MLSREQLQRAASESGFQVESFEKVHVLVRLLEAVRTHPFLGRRMALKGGTALNLFVLDLPRLSVEALPLYTDGAELRIRRPQDQLVSLHSSTWRSATCTTTPSAGCGASGTCS